MYPSTHSSAPLPAEAKVDSQNESWLSRIGGCLKSVPFLSLHVACVSVIFTGVNSVALALCGAFYFVRMFGITAGYHRYFSHRSFKTSRLFQFVLAWLGCSAMQKGPLWWAAHQQRIRTLRGFGVRSEARLKIAAGRILGKSEQSQLGGVA